MLIAIARGKASICTEEVPISKLPLYKHDSTRLDSTQYYELIICSTTLQIMQSNPALPIQYKRYRTMDFLIR